MSEGKLTVKQRRFVAEYCIDANATRAAKAAGYSEDTAHAIGHENLSKPEVRQEIDRQEADRLSAASLTADFVLAGLIANVEAARNAEKFSDVNKGLELLGKRLSMWIEKTENVTTLNGATEVRVIEVPAKGSV